MVLRRPSGFIEPCQPSKVGRPPSGADGDVPAILFGARLRWLAPASVEQDVGGLNACAIVPKVNALQGNGTLHTS